MSNSFIPKEEKGVQFGKATQTFFRRISSRHAQPLRHDVAAQLADCL